MNMKHTPGPWESTTDGIELSITAKNGNLLATLAKGDEANARLIAAAPELLEALKSMNCMGGDERGGYCICPRNDGSAPKEKHSTTCNDAREAIAKAEGKL